jgi:hypothetical protein
MRIFRNILLFPSRTLRPVTHYVHNTVLWLRGQRNPPWRAASMEQTFSLKFKCNGWHSDESVSGSGSTMAATEIIRRELPILTAQFGIKSLLDIPCGDHHWLQHMALDLDCYIGADIVPELVELTRAKYRNARKSFVKLDLVRDQLPPVDMILCRDCLVHFPIADIFQALENIISSQSKYLLATNFPEVKRNVDIRLGRWRKINLLKPPFCLPEPLQVIDDNPAIGASIGKTLSLWSIADIGRVFAQHRAENPAGVRAPYFSSRQSAKLSA